MNQHVGGEELQSYPVELIFPNLKDYATGNVGIPYVYTFDSGRAGPRVMINALTHGNEVCGAIVVKALLDQGMRPRLGQLTLSFANVAAYLRFDPAQPDRSRFVDQDFNRVWDAGVLDNMRLHSHELRRAREFRPVVDQIDLLLDLHSMHERGSPLIMAGPLDKAADFARALGRPDIIIRDAGHSDGRRLRDYGEFGDPASAKNALVIECGQHWELGALHVARTSTARFLELAGVIERSDLDKTWWIDPSEDHSPRVIQITEAVVAASMDFRFAQPFVGLERLPEAGTVIGWQDGQPVRTPYDDCVLVQPSLRQLRPGVTVVRLGRIQD